MRAWLLVTLPFTFISSALACGEHYSDPCPPDDYSIYMADSEGNEKTYFEVNEMPHLISENAEDIEEQRWYYLSDPSDVNESGLSEGSLLLHTGKSLPDLPMNLLKGHDWKYFYLDDEVTQITGWAVIGTYRVNGIEEDFEHIQYFGVLKGDLPVTVTPEPTSSALFLLGAGALALKRRKKKTL